MVNQLVIRIQKFNISVNISANDESGISDFSIIDENRKIDASNISYDYLDNLEKGSDDSIDYSSIYDDEIEKLEETDEIENNNIWKIIIPSINLEADICEGTEMEVLDYTVGHFAETSLIDGNVGLAAHNRGYRVNYFQNLKYIEINDEIIYKYKDIEKKYYVQTIEIIENTDWSYLEETKDNRITLITCVENQPEYRLCVQGVME